MKRTHLVGILLVSLLLLGCSEDQDADSAQAENESSEISVNRSAPSRTARAPAAPAAAPSVDEPLISAPRLKGQAETSDGSGMDMIIYASDRREYQESLQLIAEQSTDQQFQQLDAALRYLMINDPSIMNKEQLLFEFVNGKTGTEIMQATADLLKARDSADG